jgi:putative transposase
MNSTTNRKRYATDLTDEHWKLLAPLIPEISPNATRETIPRREIVNGILYVLRTGCAWRLVPHDLPNGKTLYHYFRQWKLSGVWEQAMTSLRKQARRAIDRDEEPSAAIIDSQSIKTSAVRGIERGFDAGKKNLGTQTTYSR